MSDKTRTLKVVLDKDMDSGDATVIMNAVAMIKGVEHVAADIVGGEDHISRCVAINEYLALQWKLLNLLSFAGDKDKLRRVKEILGE